MGSGVVTAAVVDAGPLIHLYEIDKLLILQLFAPLYLPDTVWSETVGQGRLADVDVLPNVPLKATRNSGEILYFQGLLSCK